MPMRFTRDHRFHKGDNFKPGPQLGAKYEFGGFVCRMIPGSTARNAPCRLAVIASRRVGNAVKRNRGKRVFREIFRHCQGHLPAHTDVIIVLRSKFDHYSFQQLRGQFLKACQRWSARTD